jgi:hypothetical protein
LVVILKLGRNLLDRQTTILENYPRLGGAVKCDTISAEAASPHKLMDLRLQRLECVVEK